MVQHQLQRPLLRSFSRPLAAMPGWGSAARRRQQQNLQSSHFKSNSKDAVAASKKRTGKLTTLVRLLGANSF